MKFNESKYWIKYDMVIYISFFFYLFNALVCDSVAVYFIVARPLVLLPARMRSLVKVNYLPTCLPPGTNHDPGMGLSF